MIYLITNTINNKQYVGKTSRSVESRWKDHLQESRRNDRRYLYRAMRKYGTDNFTVELIEDCYGALDNERERFWIKELSPEYNMTDGGEGGWIHDQTGNTWSVKDSSKMGLAWQGKKRPPETVEKLSSGNNYQSNFHIYTPWGIFDTYIDALTTAKDLRTAGRRDVVTDKCTLRKYCESDIILNVTGRRTYPEWRGKSTQSIGFNKVPKQND